MRDDTVYIERKNKIALVIMNRAKKKNAFDESMFLGLEKVTEELKQDLPRAVVITGAGDDAFCSGFDVDPENPLVADFLKALENKDVEAAARLIHRIRKAVDTFYFPACSHHCRNKRISIRRWYGAGNTM